MLDWAAEIPMAEQAMALGAKDFLLKGRLDAAGLKRAISCGLTRERPRR